MKYDNLYLGRQPYVTTTERRSSPMFPGKHFDALGRAYPSGKLPDNRYYYIDGNKIYKPRTVDVYSEFDVWMKIIKDIDGNDAQMFIKEDKKSGIKKDSSSYYGGRWEIFEKDEDSGTALLKSSDGTVSWSKYDNKNRLTESYLINGNGDTLISEQYGWKDGRLAKTAIDGVKRVYIYGESLQDTVKVIPSDGWIKDYYNSSYNGTAGKIPKEGTVEYERFARRPYGYVFSEEPSGTSFAPKNSAVSLNVLQKVSSSGCVDEEFGMPAAECVRDEYEDIIKWDSDESREQGQRYGFPGEKEHINPNSPKTYRGTRNGYICD